MAKAKLFERALEEQITKKVEPCVVDMKREVAKAVLLSAVAASPVFSGYFASNWRITMGRGQARDVKLFPPWARVQRPPLSMRPGEFVGNIASNTQTELAKLNNDKELAKARTRVAIATAVPYAGVLEAKLGILQAARAVGSQVKQIIGSGRA